MKLTCAMLNAQTPEAFDGAPEVAGELECFIRFVISKDEKALVVADTKQDAEGEQRAKMARFEFLSLPDGCGKGAKVKLSGMRFVRQASREYNGKTYHDMVYGFGSCEVLEAVAGRSGGGWKGGGGGSWRKDPDERASIERQVAFKAGVEAANAVLSLPDAHPLRANATAVYDDTIRRIFNLGCELLQIGHGSAAEPASTQQNRGVTGRPGAGATTNPTQAEKTQQTANGAAWSPGLTAKGRETATTVGKLVVEMFGKAEAPLAFENLTEWIGREGNAMPGMKAVTQIKSDRQATAIVAKIGPLHHWWKNASKQDQASLADTVLKPGTGPDARWDDIQALMALGSDSGDAPEPPGQGDDAGPMSPFGADATTWSGFLSLIQSATGQAEAKATSLAEAAALALFGDGYTPSRLRWLTEDAMAAVVDRLRQEANES